MKPQFSWTNEIASILGAARVATKCKNCPERHSKMVRLLTAKIRVKNHRRQSPRSIRRTGIGAISMMTIIDLTIVGSDRVACAN